MELFSLSKVARQICRQSISLTLSSALLLTSIITPSQASIAVGEKPSASALLKQYTPPAEIGTVVDAYIAPESLLNRGSDDSKIANHPIIQSSNHRPLVIHIQDLHANYGVQVNIAKILEFLDTQIGKGKYKVAVEGAEGPVFITEFAKLTDKKFKADVSDKLMKEAELTGTEYFSIVNGYPDLLWGVENEHYHQANVNLFQSTYEGKQQIAKLIQRLQADLLPIKEKYYSRPMRKLDKEAADYAVGKVSMEDYTSDLLNKASKLHIDVASRYPELAKVVTDPNANVDKVMTEQTELFKNVQSGLAKMEAQRNIANSTIELDVLNRLMLEEVTTEEVRELAPKLPTLVSHVKYLFDSTGLSYDKANLAELASASLDFYAMALLRDKYLAENTIALLRQEATTTSVHRAPFTVHRDFIPSRTTEHGARSTVVLVTGGFHTPGITKILRDKNISYVTISPTVTDHTEKDKRLYVARLMDRHDSAGDVLSGNHAVQFILNGWVRVQTVTGTFLQATKDTPLASGVTEIAKSIRQKAGKLRDLLGEKFSNNPAKGSQAGAINPRGSGSSSNGNGPKSTLNPIESAIAEADQAESMGENDKAAMIMGFVVDALVHSIQSEDRHAEIRRIFQRMYPSAVDTDLSTPDIDKYLKQLSQSLSHMKRTPLLLKRAATEYLDEIARDIFNGRPIEARSKLNNFESFLAGQIKDSDDHFQLHLRIDKSTSQPKPSPQLNVAKELTAWLEKAMQATYPESISTIAEPPIDNGPQQELNFVSHPVIAAAIGDVIKLAEAAKAAHAAGQAQEEAVFSEEAAYRIHFLHHTLTMAQAKFTSDTLPRIQHILQTLYPTTNFMPFSDEDLKSAIWWLGQIEKNIKETHKSTLPLLSKTYIGQDLNLLSIYIFEGNLKLAHERLNAMDKHLPDGRTTEDLKDDGLFIQLHPQGKINPGAISVASQVEIATTLKVWLKTALAAAESYTALQAPRQPHAFTPSAAQIPERTGDLSGLKIKPDIEKDFSELFGDKMLMHADGTTTKVNVQEAIASLASHLAPEIRASLKAKSEFRQAVINGRAQVNFPKPYEKFVDVDGQKLTFREIVEGAIDNFFGRDTKNRWRLNAKVPLNSRTNPTLNPGLEGTGPVSDLGMLAHTYNAVMEGYRSVLQDWEDARPGQERELFEALRNVKEVNNGRGRTFTHPIKGKKYEIKVDIDHYPTPFVRYPGLQLVDSTILLNGKPIPAMVAVAVIYALNNYGSLALDKTGVLYYSPKIETPADALIVAKLLKQLEEIMGIPRGTIKIKALNETTSFTIHIMPIMWILRDWLIGPNVGRWDYLNKFIELIFFRNKGKAGILPDPQRVNMLTDVMHEYNVWNAEMTLLVSVNPEKSEQEPKSYVRLGDEVLEVGRMPNGAPIGGMSAIMPNEASDPDTLQKAENAIRFDKLRERLAGLFIVKNETGSVLYDTYRQSWIASPLPKSYVQAGAEPLLARFDELQAIVDRLSSDQKNSLIKLKMLGKDGKISPRRLSPADLTFDKLFSHASFNNLFSPPQGGLREADGNYSIQREGELTPESLAPTSFNGHRAEGDITEQGIRYSIYMASEYLFQLLNRRFAAKIYDPLNGTFMMNDLATFEIFWHWLWTINQRQGIELTQNGTAISEGDVWNNLGYQPTPALTKAGNKITRELIQKLLNERRAAVKAYFAAHPDNPQKFDRDLADVTMDMLERMLNYPHYIPWGSRIIFAVLDKPKEEREQILDALFSTNREAVEGRVASHRMPASTLAAYDYVHDVFADPTENTKSHLKGAASTPKWELLAAGLSVGLAILVSPWFLILVPLPLAESLVGYRRNRARGMTPRESFNRPAAVETENLLDIPAVLRSHEASHQWFGFGEISAFFAKHVIAVLALFAQGIQWIVQRFQRLLRLPHGIALSVEESRLASALAQLDRFAAVAPIQLVNEVSAVATRMFQNDAVARQALVEQRRRLAGRLAQAASA